MSTLGEDHDIVLQKMKQSISQRQIQVNQTLYKRDEMAKTCKQIDHVCVAACKIAHSNISKTIKDLKDNADPGYNISYDNIDIRRERRHMSMADQNLDIHWVNHRCTFNQVHGNHLSTHPGPVFIKCPTCLFFQVFMSKRCKDRISLSLYLEFLFSILVRYLSFKVFVLATSHTSMSKKCQ